MKKLISVLLVASIISLSVFGGAFSFGVSAETLDEPATKKDKVDTPTSECSEDENDIYIDESQLARIEWRFTDGYNNEIDDIFDSSEVTAQDIENRNGSLIVERCIGIVTDAARGDGVVLNSDDDICSYIGYANCDVPYTEGTIIVTYLVYNPKTTWVDDIIDRYDFVLTREYEE